jgi:hypothetical protein
LGDDAAFDAGSDDAAPDDAARPSDASLTKDTAPDVIDIAAACAARDGSLPASACGNSETVIDCALQGTSRCAGSDVCIEWIDAKAGIAHAACVAPSQTSVCISGVDKSHCNGAEIDWCNGPVHAAPDQPPGWGTVDCKATWAPDLHRERADERAEVHSGHRGSQRVPRDGRPSRGRVRRIHGHSRRAVRLRMGHHVSAGDRDRRGRADQRVRALLRAP